MTEKVGSNAASRYEVCVLESAGLLALAAGLSGLSKVLQKL